MNIIVICEQCSSPHNNIEMKTKELLSFDKETKSQAQTYECPICYDSVLVIVEINE